MGNRILKSIFGQNDFSQEETDVKKTSLLNNSAVWLGASISVAEIMSGAYLAGMGLRRGLAAIVIGHLIGGLLFYL